MPRIRIPIVLFCLPLFFTATNSCKDVPRAMNPSDTGIATGVNQPSDAPDNRIPVNAAIPFGATDLSKYSYPHFWEVDPYRDDGKESQEEQEIEKIAAVFHRLNASKTIEPPVIRRITTFDLNAEYVKDTMYFDTTAIRQLDSCVYQLPDLNGYQCYYFRQYSTKRNEGTYGSLLLLDPSTQTGNLLTTYFEYGREQNLSLRYFLVANDTIHLYDGSCYDDGIRLRESFKITVGVNGKPEIIRS